MHQLSVRDDDSVAEFLSSTLESVSIPASVIDIGSYAFYQCTIEDSTDSSSGQERR